MKIARRLTNHWQPKLVCLLLATGLWFIIHQNVSQPQPVTPRLWPADTAPTRP
jgi:hypothetical protein